MHNYQLFYCPDRKDAGPGYGMNSLCTRLDIGRPFDAAQLVVIADVLPEAICARPGFPGPGLDPQEWWANDIGNDICRAYNSNSYRDLGQPPTHGDGVIYGYLDGHAKWAREEQMDQLHCWHPLARPPGE
jgi:prepilin-type processing-associated H-X9-DG protein